MITFIVSIKEATLASSSDGGMGLMITSIGTSWTSAISSVWMLPLFRSSSPWFMMEQNLLLGTWGCNKSAKVLFCWLAYNELLETSLVSVTRILPSVVADSKSGVQSGETTAPRSFEDPRSLNIRPSISELAVFFSNNTNLHKCKIRTCNLQLIHFNPVVKNLYTNFAIITH